MAVGIKERRKEGEKLPTRYFSSIQESSVAKAVGGRKTANSGATDFGGKSDVSIHALFNIECKFINYSLKSVHKHSFLSGQHPFYCVLCNISYNNASPNRLRVREA